MEKTKRTRRKTMIMSNRARDSGRLKGTLIACYFGLTRPLKKHQRAILCRVNVLRLYSGHPVPID